MHLPNGFERMSAQDQARLLRIQDFVGELNIRLFEAEEMLSILEPDSDQFPALSARYDAMVELVQELQDDLAFIGQVYGLTFNVR